MPNVTGLTLEQLRAMSKAQILAAINGFFAPMTKRDLIFWLIDRQTAQDSQVVTYYPDGQIESLLEVDRDAETGAVLSKRRTAWTYYATGEVHIIRVRNFDADNNELPGYRIEHYLDGRQPVLVVM